MAYNIALQFEDGVTRIVPCEADGFSEIVTGAGLGLASLLLSDYPGAFRPTWAWLTLAWGVALVAVAELRREAS